MILIILHLSQEEYEKGSSEAWEFNMLMLR